MDNKRQKKKGNKKGSGSSGGTNRQVVDLTKFGFTSTSSAEKKKKKRAASAAAPGAPTDGDDEVEIVTSPPKRARTSTGNDAGSSGRRRNDGNGGGSAGPPGKSSGGTVDLTSDDPEGGEGKEAAAADGAGGPSNDGRTAGLVTVGAMARSLIAGMPGRDGRGDGMRPAPRSPPRPSPAAAARSPSRSVSSNRSAASSRAGRHPVHALALVRIQCKTAPSRIVTSHAVAAARSQPHDAAGGKPDHPRVLRAGCVMGRSGAAGSRPRPDCIDLGIPNDSVGISRRHVEVVRVCNLDPPSGLPRRQQEQPSQETQLSQQSVSSVSSRPRRRPPYAMIRVLPGAMNGVQHHYTRRDGDGARRMSDALSSCYLEPGEERRLRLGDVVEFLTAPTHLFYCVVGLGGSAPASPAPSPAAGEDLSSRLAEAAAAASAASGGRPTLSAGPGDGMAAAPSTGEDVPGEEAKIERRAADSPGVTAPIAEPAVVPVAVAAEPEGADGDSKEKENAGESAGLKSPEASFEVGAIVEVRDRVLPGKNSQGGVARITAVHPTADGGIAYDVAYVVERRRERGVGAAHVSLHDAHDSPDKAPRNAPKAKRSAAGGGEGRDGGAKDRKPGGGAGPPDAVAPRPRPRKGDRVKAHYVETCSLGVQSKTWYIGTVAGVGPVDRALDDIPAGATCSLSIRFDDFGTEDRFNYPHEDVVVCEDGDLSDLFPADFCVGDTVDGYFQNGADHGADGKWFRGRISSVGDGGFCDILYNDGEVESGIPTNQGKVRLIRPFDGDHASLVGKATLLEGGRSGTIASVGDDGVQVRLPNGLMRTVPVEVALKRCFEHVIAGLPASQRHSWPAAAPAAGTGLPPVVTEEKKRRDRDARGPRREAIAPPRRRGLRVEPVSVSDYADLIGGRETGGQGPLQQRGVAVARRTARDFPATLPNLLMMALNGPEPETGVGHLVNLLAVHDAVPNKTTCKKLMELLKLGPKDNGRAVYFKDCYRIELTADYVLGILGASSRLVRADGTALFGPSSWEDIETLLEQSTAQTENVISGGRLAEALHLAGRGARLLSLMFQTELRCVDLSWTRQRFDSDALNSMPTVRLILSRGARDALKLAVRQTTKMLMRHSNLIFSGGRGIGDSRARENNGKMSTTEAGHCFSDLCSTVSYVSFLFCIQESLSSLADPSLSYLINSEFSSEVLRSTEDLPSMKVAERTKFERRIKLHFCSALQNCGEFSRPLATQLATIIGLEGDSSCCRI